MTTATPTRSPASPTTRPWGETTRERAAFAGAALLIVPAALVAAWYVILVARTKAWLDAIPNLLQRYPNTSGDPEYYYNDELSDALEATGPQAADTLYFVLPGFACFLGVLGLLLGLIPLHARRANANARAWGYALMAFTVGAWIVFWLHWDTIILITDLTE